MLYKEVSAPLSIHDLDTDIMSDITYLIDYKKSSIQKIDLIKYISDTGIKADISWDKCPVNDKIIMTEYYMNMNNFIHIPNINKNILKYIYYIKNPNSDMTNEEIHFINNNMKLFLKWISFYDSYFMYMMCYTMDKDKIKHCYDRDKIINDNDLSPNIVSLLLDEFFYDYFKTHVNKDNIYYWNYYYNRKYDSKSFNEIMLNDNNFFIKILKDFKHPQFKEFITKTIS